MIMLLAKMIRQKGSKVCLLDMFMKLDFFINHCEYNFIISVPKQQREKRQELRLFI